MEDNFKHLLDLKKHRILSNGVKTFPIFPSVCDRELSIQEILSITKIIDMRKMENFEFQTKENEEESDACETDDEGEPVKRSDFLDIDMKEDAKPYIYEFLVKIEPSLMKTDSMQDQLSKVSQRVSKVNEKLKRAAQKKKSKVEEVNSCEFLLSKRDP